MCQLQYTAVLFMQTLITRQTDHRGRQRTPEESNFSKPKYPKEGKKYASRNGTELH